jgi:putative oxidoreductase
MDKLKALWKAVIDILDPAGDWVALLPIRLLMAYEFFKAGLTKFNGSNWFGNIQDNFPFPFNVIPLCLFVGLFTRFWAFSLIILTVVAIFGVHWPDEWSSLAELWKGYAITDKGFGNYRVPLLFLAMLLPLLFIGGGKLSLDNVLARKIG